MPAKKTEKEPRAYLLRGDDDFQKNTALNDLLGELVSGDFGDFDLELMDPDSVTSERILSGLSIPPFGSVKRVVLIKHAQKIDLNQQELLASSVGKIPNSGCLVLLTPAPEKVDGRVKKGSEVTGNLLKAIRKIGKVMEFGGGKTREKIAPAREFVKSLLSQTNINIDSAALETLLQRVGTDFSTLNSEVSKLVSYCADTGRITRIDVENVTSETPEDRIFALIDAVAERNQPAALDLLDNIFRVGTDSNAEAARTLALIARQYRYIQQARLIKSFNVRSLKKDSIPEQVLCLLPSAENVTDLVARQYWQESKLSRQAGKLSESNILQAFGAIAKCDMRLKGGAEVEDPRMAMELLVCELSGNVKSNADFT